MFRQNSQKVTTVTSDVQNPTIEKSVLNSPCCQHEIRSFCSCPEVGWKFTVLFLKNSLRRIGASKKKLTIPTVIKIPWIVKPDHSISFRQFAYVLDSRAFPC